MVSVDFSSFSFNFYNCCRLLFQQQVLACPVCKSENKLPIGGISRLPINYLLQNRILLSLQQTPTCDLCMEDAPVSRSLNY